MNILRYALSVAFAGAAGTTLAEVRPAAVGTWAIEQGLGEAGYVLAARGIRGDFLICFNSGNVRTIVVATGAETSVLARGSCTVFRPSAESGVVVDFPAHDVPAPEQPVALGTFTMIVPQEQ